MNLFSSNCFIFSYILFMSLLVTIPYLSSIISLLSETFVVKIGKFNTLASLYTTGNPSYSDVRTIKSLILKYG